MAASSHPQHPWSNELRVGVSHKARVLLGQGLIEGKEKTLAGIMGSLLPDY